jgi:hypothetical protein
MLRWVRLWYRVQDHANRQVDHAASFFQRRLRHRTSRHAFEGQQLLLRVNERRRCRLHRSSGLRNGVQDQTIKGAILIAMFSPFAGTRCPRFAPVPCIFRSITPVLRALTWASSYSEETVVDRLVPSGLHIRALYVSHFGNCRQGPSTFPLIPFPRP